MAIGIRATYDDEIMSLSGNTPLHLAARAGKTTAVATLLHQGATAAMKVTTKIFLRNILCSLENIMSFMTMTLAMMVMMMMEMMEMMMMMEEVIEIVKS